MSAAGGLSRRERQIMDILYQRGKASASEVREAMEAAPGYSAVRAMLRVLEEKGHVKHQAEGLEERVGAGVAPRQGKAERGKTGDGALLQGERGTDCGGAAGRLFHAARTRTSSPRPDA